MKKYFVKTIVLYLTCIPLLNSQIINSDKIEETVIKKFQKKLIDDGEAGGNVVMLYKNGKIIYHHIQNSYKKGDKLITDQTLFPIWSMSKPITTIVSPKVGFNNLIPCKPIDPITVNVAASSLTLSGIFATKFFGTQTYSA